MSVSPLDCVDGQRRPRDPAFIKMIVGIGRQRNISITCCAILGIFCCLAGGFYLILCHSWYAAFGVPLFVEGIILSAYMRHECAHLLAFKSKKNNLLLGEILSWITGDQQSPFSEYRRAHLRHHAEKVDLIGVDLHIMLRKFPGWCRAAILKSEEFYIPIIFFLVRADGIRENIWQPAGNRPRAVSTIGIILLTYYALVIAGPTSLILYLIAITLKIHCIRFVDTFQHTYDCVPADKPNMRENWIYEQKNTFSFPVFKRYPFLNMLLLNFGFHNAHHAVPSCPWHHLPKLNQVLVAYWQARTPPDPSMFFVEAIGFDLLLLAFHEHRVSRILSCDTDAGVDLISGFPRALLRGTFTDNLLG